MGRNDNNFNNTNNPISHHHVIVLATEYIVTAHVEEVNNHATTIIKVSWKPPARGNFKLNIDGLAIENPGRGGIGGVFRDHEGNWILGFCMHLTLTTPTMVN